MNEKIKRFREWVKGLAGAVGGDEAVQLVEDQFSDVTAALALGRLEKSLGDVAVTDAAQAPAPEAKAEAPAETPAADTSVIDTLKAAVDGLTIEVKTLGDSLKALQDGMTAYATVDAVTVAQKDAQRAAEAFVDLKKIFISKAPIAQEITDEQQAVMDKVEKAVTDGKSAADDDGWTLA
jgi:hypothetical protein